MKCILICKGIFYLKLIISTQQAGLIEANLIINFIIMWYVVYVLLKIGSVQKFKSLTMGCGMGRESRASGFINSVAVGCY